MDILTSALRQLRAHPLFAALIILLLALGIGANTAIFSVVHAVLLKPLPYPQPGDLVVARKPPRDGNAANFPGGGDMMPDTEFQGWTAAVPKSFLSLAAYRNSSSTLQLGDGAVRVPTAAVTGEFFPTLGVNAWRGRLFEPTDLKPGAPMVTVLSYSTWQSRFNGNDSALGQVVKIDDVAHTIVGVMPPSFEFIDPVQFWRPLQLMPNAPGQLRIQMVRVLGRLLPGTPLDTAQRELDGISERFWSDLAGGLINGPAGGDVERRVINGPGLQGATNGPREPSVATASGGGIATTNSGQTQQIVRSPDRQFSPPAPGRQVVVGGPQGGPAGAGPGPRLSLPFADAKVQLMLLQEQLVRQSRTTLWLLLGAVTFVLLIACANIANLQMARTAARRREVAIRAALGATPGRLALELLAENVLLALVGGLLGVLLAWWGTLGMQAWLADYLPRVNPVGLSGPVLGFGFLLAVSAGLGFGLAPAWQGTRVNLLDALKEGGHTGIASGQRWRYGLVALEVALALVLAANTGLLVKSIYNLYATELGFRTGNVLTANLALPRRYGAPAQQRDFAQRWLAALQTLPGVQSAAITDLPPLSPYTQMVLVATAQGSTANVNASVNSAPQAMAVAGATPDFFRAAGIALRQGRFFAGQDGFEAPPVAIVNEAFVKQYYPKGLTLGAQVSLPDNSRHGGATASIVGVVADIRPRGFESAAQPLAYFPLAQFPRQRLSAVLQFEGDAGALARAVTQATHKIDADLALDNPQTLEQQIARQTAPRRITLYLTAAFAATAVLLAALGILGVMSYTVAQRTQEIGVRMALGADAGRILRWTMQQGSLAIALGLAVGLGLSFISGRLLKSMLYSVSGFDPVVLTLASLGLAAVGLVACWLPALRASRVDPNVALRTE